MTKTLEFCFDIGSPAAYIAWHVIPKIADAAGAELVYRPVLLGGIFKAQGNASPASIPAKGRWFGQDLKRWAALYGLDYRRNDDFPQNTLMHMRGATALLGTEGFVPYVSAFMQALHVDNRVIGEPSVAGEILSGLGHDPAAFLDRANAQEVKDQLKVATEDAAARGMFGAPTFFVGDNMHFGQDRMWMVAEDLGTSIHAALGEAA